MTTDWRTQVFDQLHFYWQQWRPRLDGLTDHEYFWEPVPDCWSIRSDGAGGFTFEWAYPEPDPPPVTTIAWRLNHISGHVFALRESHHFGDGSYRMDHADYPGSAEAALSYLDDRFAAWRRGIDRLSEADLAAPVGEAEGPYAEMPFATLVLHLNRETMHHGAEVSLLRDLYRASAAGRQWR